MKRLTTLAIIFLFVALVPLTAQQGKLHRNIDDRPLVITKTEQVPGSVLFATTQAYGTFILHTAGATVDPREPRDAGGKSQGRLGRHLVATRGEHLYARKGHGLSCQSISWSEGGHYADASLRGRLHLAGLPVGALPRQQLGWVHPCGKHCKPHPSQRKPQILPFS